MEFHIVLNPSFLFVVIWDHPSVRSAPRWRGVYRPLCNAREFSGQPFSAMNKRSFQLEQTLPLVNRLTRAFMPKHACFFHKNARSFIYHSYI